jgi:hypothetical protein
MSRRTETAYKAIIRASQHDMTKSRGFRRNGKCCGCVATVHVLIRGDLPGSAAFVSESCALHGNMTGDRAEVSKSHSRRRTPSQSDWTAGHKPGVVTDSREDLPRRRAEHREGEVPNELS